MNRRGIHKHQGVVLSHSTHHSSDETTGWKLLANAIIIQAVRDAREGVISYPAFYSFVHSGYFEVLSRGCVSADDIMKEVYDG